MFWNDVIWKLNYGKAWVQGVTSLKAAYAWTAHFIFKTESEVELLQSSKIPLNWFSAFFLSLSLRLQNLDNYKQTAEQYNQAATKAEAHIR